MRTILEKKRRQLTTTTTDNSSGGGARCGQFRRKTPANDCGDTHFRLGENGEEKGKKKTNWVWSDQDHTVDTVERDSCGHLQPSNGDNDSSSQKFLWKDLRKTEREGSSLALVLIGFSSSSLAS